MSEKLSVLVMGATGNQGGAVVQALLSKEYDIRTLTRNPDSANAKKLAEQGVTVIKGDFSDADSLQKAAAGVDTLYAMTTPFEKGTAEETKQGVAIADAAKKAGVGHLIFGSVANADKNTGIPHFDSKYEVEKHIKSLDIPYTISAPVFFMDNFLSPWFLPALKEGKLMMAMPGDVALQQVSVKNIGEFVASLVERREKVFGQRIDIAGDELTGDQAAAIISKASGHEIKYEGSDPEALRKDNADWADMFNWFIDVGYSADIQKLRSEYSEVKWQKVEEWSQEQDWNK